MELGYGYGKEEADNRSKVYTRLLPAIFVLAFIVRIFWIGPNPAIFHATRQYHSAILARSLYLNTDEHRDEKERIPALKFRNSKGKADPRINELFTSWMYKIAGKEDLVIPRMMSVLYWLAGGLILYKIAFLFFGMTGAMFSLIFYLFFPFGINISQSIQPESLLNMLFLWAVLQTVKHFRSDKGEYFYSAAFVCGFAVFFKFIVIFPLTGIIVFAGINKYGLKKFIFRWRTVWFFVIFFSVGLSFYLSNIFWNTAMRGVASVVIFPGLLKLPYFWKGWLIQIGKVTGIIPLILGILLFFTVRKRATRFMLAGLFLGYIFYGLVFSYATATHDNYQIVLFSITALMLGQAGYLISTPKKGVKKRSGFKLAGSFVILASAVIFSLFHQYNFIKGDHQLRMWSPAFFLTGEQGSFFPNNVTEENIVENAKRIGKMTGHGINNIFLSRSYGNAVKYYGAMFGKAWPTEEDFNFRRLKGKDNPPAKELYYSKFAKQKPRFFIITDLVSWEQQPDLQKFLQENFQIFAQEKGFLIFDLRKMKTGFYSSNR